MQCILQYPEIYPNILKTPKNIQKTDILSMKQTNKNKIKKNKIPKNLANFCKTDRVSRIKNTEHLPTYRLTKMLIQRPTFT